MTYSSLAALWLVALTSSAVGAPVVDAEYQAYGRTYALIGGPLQRAQTFTVGLAGRLTSFSFELEEDGDVPPTSLTWGIYSTTSEIPDELPIASGIQPVTFDYSQQHLVVTVDVSGAAIAVSPGEMLAFGLGNLGATLADVPWFIFGTSASENTLYPGGDAFIRVIDGSEPDIATWTLTPDVDWRFTTYVDPVLAPEPESVWLIGASFLAVAGLKLRVRSVDNRRYPEL
jgi:hypothetical protein